MSKTSWPCPRPLCIPGVIVSQGQTLQSKQGASRGRSSFAILLFRSIPNVIVNIAKPDPVFTPKVSGTLNKGFLTPFFALRADRHGLHE